MSGEEGATPNFDRITVLPNDQPVRSLCGA